MMYSYLEVNNLPKMLVASRFLQIIGVVYAVLICSLRLVHSLQKKTCKSKHCLLMPICLVFRDEGKMEPCISGNSNKYAIQTTSSPEKLL